MEKKRTIDIKTMSLTVAVWLFTVGFPPGAVHAVIQDVSAINLTFQPTSITIMQGDTVTWTNKDFVDHTVTSGTGCVADGLWDADIGAHPFSRTFNVPGTYPYFCSIHCASGMTGTVVVNPVILAAPFGQQTFSFPPAEQPVVDADKASSRPIGIGALAVGGDTLTVMIAIGQYAVPVDLFAAFTVSTDPLTVVNIQPDLSSQNLTLQVVAGALASGTLPAGVVPWMSAVSQGNEFTLFANVPTAGIASGQYTAFLLVTPHGGSLTDFDLYETSFTIP